jgi:hypothetical protein
VNLPNKFGLTICVAIQVLVFQVIDGASAAVVRYLVALRLTGCGQALCSQRLPLDGDFFHL